MAVTGLSRYIFEVRNLKLKAPHGLFQVPVCAIGSQLGSYPAGADSLPSVVSHDPHESGWRLAGFALAP